MLSKSPHAWFNLGLTIVDSLDTLLIAGLMDEYLQARHWVANHLVFHDGSNVQFFEVNIRILGGLVSAYYLSGGDDLYLHKAEQLSDRCACAGFDWLDADDVAAGKTVIVSLPPTQPVQTH